MPIYEYRCKKGHTFEVMQRMTDDPVSSCQTCSAPVQRVFHPIAVHFKGSGFYNTDYGTRKRSREKEAGEGSGKGSKDEGSGKGSKDEGSSKSDSATSTKEAGKSESSKSSSSKSDSSTPSPPKSSSSD
jgi:putative FmdB family regulatory protein